LAQYASEVRGGVFPAPEHCYSMEAEQLERFREEMGSPATG
jgi:hypothetical protein